jgi:hypothetical protein
MISGCGLYLTGSGYDPLTEYCENGNEPAGTTRSGGFLDNAKDK